jgi:hypothetical protein
MATVIDCFGQTVKLPRSLPSGWDRRDLRDGSFHSFARYSGSATLRVMARDSGRAWKWSIEGEAGRLLEHSNTDFRTAMQAIRAAERATRRLGFALPSSEAAAQ